MKKIITICFLVCSLFANAQKADTIYKAGDVYVEKTIKVFTIDSTIKVQLMKPLPKIVNNFIYTSGKKRYRVILYANGVYTKTEEK